jgi:hypothetical protein
LQKALAGGDASRASFASVPHGSTGCFGPEQVRCTHSIQLEELKLDRLLAATQIVS